MEKAREEWSNGELITLAAKKSSQDTLKKLKTIIEKYPGDCPTCLKIDIENMLPVLIRLSDDYMTMVDSSFFKEIEKLAGEGSIETRLCACQRKTKNKKTMDEQKKRLLIAD